MLVRLKFKKEGPIRFVGHLDMMRTFQKMFTRAGIPIAYSEGFNPHQIFSFASALAVGVSSESEYMDVKLTEDVAINVLIEAINLKAPEGIFFLDGVEIDNKETSAMASVVAATYRIEVLNSIITEDMLSAMMSQETLIIRKKNKKGKINDFDLRPGIINILLKDKHLIMTIANGSHFNIKPEMVLEKLLALNDLNYVRCDYRFHRVEIYHDHNGLRPLLEVKLGL
ncbi:TIGR03936 family radical SAM-associated protein [Petrocella sp. FN5]|uniref:TIGR03936 family radical SAM-associated protein n=1 Tax=Petrocella sp. FN5 TaxID=3032002 RepID=UPI0023DABF8D|nr:TIGR03936 family radical SAM-associated protein [Petrocella sp. FN5]MDF1617950.1 TIGR03936 family radical SAM-associated protein [Petrocella sp. FN5]